MPSVANRFALAGRPARCERYGNGHINETYLLETDAPRAYILQKINRRVFADVPALMRNIALVTRHLAAKADDPRRVLRLVPTLEGADWLRDGDGEFWRVYEYVTGCVCLERAESAADFYQSAVAFGQFQTLLADFPAATLTETIPRFHDTPARYAALHEALQADALGRARDAQPEIDFALEHEREADALTELRRLGELPLRVTHNDTKLNNVLLDMATREALCVIDLDTVMPGLAAFDYGDSIRFGASTAAEDERDLGRVGLSLPLAEAYTRGFLSACGERLTALERETLPLGAKLMTLECGVRFLTDDLLGDPYFAVHRPRHNLDRCRTQFRLVADMERQWDALTRLTRA